VENFGRKQAEENGVIIYRSAQYSKYDVKKIRRYVLKVRINKIEFD
jgi:hypothetical protein